MPIGTFTANSHSHDPTARMAAAMVGPIAEATDTTSALIPTPFPSEACGKVNRTSAPLTLMIADAPNP